MVESSRSKLSSSFLAGTQIETRGSGSGDDVSADKDENPTLFLNRMTDVSSRKSSENDVSQKRVIGSINRQPDYVIMLLIIVICPRATIL